MGAAGHVLVAPDKFKGTYDAEAVAAALARGVRDAGLDAVELPVADGGDGTAAALLHARGGEWRTVRVADPLGRPVDARYAALADGTAVVDMAEASGLWRLADDERDPWRATTRGTGELIADAARAGATAVFVAAGGSATVDGGAGALEALADVPSLPPLVVVCDVTTNWEDAAAVFGPQKGADPPMVQRLAERLDALAARAPRDPRGVPRTGCAGGLSGGLWAFHGADLVPGAALVLDAAGFDAALRDAAFVLTGEGRIDEQTMAGKAVGEVARRCGEHGVPCDAVVGSDALPAGARERLGVRCVVEAGDEDAMRTAAAALARRHAAARAAS